MEYLTQPLFPLGKVLITPGALDVLGDDTGDALLLLYRHATGDWGDVCAEDAKENDLSVRNGFRILSAYTLRDGTRLWLITEADRSATTILLPSEY